MFEHFQRTQPHGYLRLKPWESYKISDNDGLMGALSTEDLNRVSTIFMAEELLA